MAVTKSLFGKSPEGKEISLYTLSNSKGTKIRRLSTTLFCPLKSSKDNGRSAFSKSRSLLVN